MAIDIHALMRELSERRPIFHSEADFQLALFRLINSKKLDCQIRMEKPFSVGQKRKSRVDIWLPTERIAIELKYFTMKFCLEYNGEPFALKQHAAADLARYGFLKDVQRLEHIVHERQTARTGFVVLITNAPTLWSRAYTRKANPNDKNFHLYGGRREVSGKLMWQKDGSPIEKDALHIYGCYTPNWKDYSCFPSDHNGGQFRYLAFAIRQIT